MKEDEEGEDARDDVSHVGNETCAECHEDLIGPYSHTIHARVLTESNARTRPMQRGCEACHGPALAHVVDGRGAGDLVSFRAETPEARRRENGVCLGCHSGGSRLYWEGGAHQMSDLACTSCHEVMRNVSVENQLIRRTVTETCSQCHLLPRSQMYRNSHHPVRERKMSCSSCHNSHGTVSDALLIQHTVNENCYSCHADKRGPFLWEHPSVAENCLNCHVPHGSVRPGMLRVGVPRLCQQCHANPGHPSSPFPPESRFVLSRGCLNCHLNIHGSNHPAGNVFSR